MTSPAPLPTTVGIGPPQTLKKQCAVLCTFVCTRVIKMCKFRPYTGKNVHICMRICMHMPFFPVYGQNLHIFITQAHTNVYRNAHCFLSVCGGPLTASQQQHRYPKKNNK